eukprot:11187968-Lingulodinium_polyedra.AAC.1
MAIQGCIAVAPRLPWKSDQDHLPRLDDCDESAANNEARTTVATLLAYRNCAISNTSQSCNSNRKTQIPKSQ